MFEPLGAGPAQAKHIQVARNYGVLPGSVCVPAASRASLSFDGEPQATDQVTCPSDACSRRA
jgi:hypothetical protein